MSPDLVCCGTCYVNFKLSDITLFIEHKKNNCAVLETTPPNFTAEDAAFKSNDFVSSILECVRCLRKFPTALPFLIHMQLEHQLFLANYISTGMLDGSDVRHDQLQQQQQPQLFNRNIPTGNEEPVVNAPQPGSQTTEQLHHTGSDHSSAASSSIALATTTTTTTTPQTTTELASIGTQTTVLSSNKRSLPSCPCGPSVAKRRAFYRVNRRNSCCTTTTNSASVCNPSRLPLSSQTLYCACSAHSSKEGGPCCSAWVPESEREKQRLSPSSDRCVTSSSQSLSTTTKKAVCDRPPSCCVAPHCQSPMVASANSLCCPCPQSRKYPKETSSTEAQTDFDPEFAVSGDLMDLSLLFASPDPNQEEVTMNFDFEFDRELESVKRANPASKQVVNATGHNVSGVDNIKLGSLMTPMLRRLSNTPVYTVENSNNSNDVNIYDLQSSGTYNPNSQGELDIVRPAKIDLDIAQVTPDVTERQPGFSCNTCGRRFKQRVHLRKHVLAQHIGRKPFSCSLCDYTTVERSHLTVHMRTHTGERPFRCRDCSYSCTQNCTLKSHYRRKHPDSRLRCETCSETFYTDMEFLKHKRICLTDRL